MSSLLGAPLSVQRSSTDRPPRDALYETEKASERALCPIATLGNLPASIAINYFQAAEATGSLKNHFLINDGIFLSSLAFLPGADSDFQSSRRTSFIRVDERERERGVHRCLFSLAPHLEFVKRSYIDPEISSSSFEDAETPARGNQLWIFF